MILFIFHMIPDFSHVFFSILDNSCRTEIFQFDFIDEPDWISSPSSVCFKTHALPHHKQTFDKTMADYSDLDRQIEQLKRCEIIAEGEVKALCAKAREILVEEGNVQRVDSPVTVCWPLF